MTRLTVDVELDEQGRPIFRLTPGQLAALGLSGSAAHEARWEVEGTLPKHPFRKYLGVALPLPEGSVTHQREMRGHDE